MTKAAGQRQALRGIYDIEVLEIKGFFILLFFCALKPHSATS